MYVIYGQRFLKELIALCLFLLIVTGSEDSRCLWGSTLDCKVKMRLLGEDGGN